MRRGIVLAVVYEPQAYHSVVSGLLAQTGRCRILMETTFTEATLRETHIESIETTSADGAKRQIQAKVFID